MKRVLFALALVVTLFFTPSVFAQPDDDPQGTPLSELVAGWLGWIFDVLAPETTPPPETGATPPEPPPPGQPMGTNDGPNGGPVVLPGG